MEEAGIEIKMNSLQVRSEVAEDVNTQELETVVKECEHGDIIIPSSYLAQLN